MAAAVRLSFAGADLQFAENSAKARGPIERLRG